MRPTRVNDVEQFVKDVQNGKIVLTNEQYKKPKRHIRKAIIVDGEGNEVPVTIELVATSHNSITK